MATWKIRQIFDGDYGCEERLPGQGPKVSVTLVDESGVKNMSLWRIIGLRNGDLQRVPCGRRI